jgi:aspartyl-tRNA synthetase
LAIAHRQIFVTGRTKAVEQIAGAEIGDVVLLPDSAKIVHDALGNLRLYLGEKLALIPQRNTHSFGWSIFR